VSVRTLATVTLLALLAASMARAESPAATDPPVPTGLFVKFHVKPGKNAAFEAAFRRMQKSMHEHEPGNLYYDLFVTVENPQLYVIMERYRNPAAVTAHNESAHLKTVLAELRDLMDGPIEPQRLVFVSAK
jgi:quinol monooxygenase YgiN